MHNIFKRLRKFPLKIHFNGLSFEGFLVEFISKLEVINKTNVTIGIKQKFVFMKIEIFVNNNKIISVIMI